MWIAFKSSQCCDLLQLPTPHLSADKPLAVPMNRMKTVGQSAACPALSHPESESKLRAQLTGSPAPLQPVPIPGVMLIHSPKAPGTEDHRDEWRQKGKCSIPPIPLVIALLETSGSSRTVCMMDGRHGASSRPGCPPHVPFSWSPAHFPLPSPQQLLYAQFATPHGLQNPVLLKQTSPQEPCRAWAVIPQHRDRCGVRKTLDL